jgi:predicted neuraminidase
MVMLRLLLTALGVAGAAMAAPAAEFVFTTAPFASAHASTLVELRNGDLLAAWFGGAAEGRPDVAIWSSRKSGGGWSEPAEIVREPDIACYNPVLFHSEDGRLWLYYKFGPHPTSWTAGRRWSDDEGKTWSRAEHLPAGIYGPIRAKPLVRPDGAIVSGTSVESYHSWAAWIERSIDNGKSWAKIGPIGLPDSRVSKEASPSSSDPFDWSDTYGIIQPSVVGLGADKLRLYARSTRQIGKVCIADSQDGGLHWTAARPIDVPNPNSGIDAVALRDGRVVLAYNNTSKGRTPLNLAVSADGEHFRMFQTLEDQPGEYSYPALIQGREGDLHITYTWNRKRIRYVRVPLAEVPEK